jgi:hypothetical protein
VPSGFCITINADGSITNSNSNSGFIIDFNAPQNLAIQLHTSFTAGRPGARSGVPFVVQHWISEKKPFSSGYWLLQYAVVEPYSSSDDLLYGRQPTSWSIRVDPPFQ